RPADAAEKTSRSGGGRRFRGLGQDGRAGPARGDVAFEDNRGRGGGEKILVAATPARPRPAGGQGEVLAEEYNRQFHSGRTGGEGSGARSACGQAHSGAARLFRFDRAAAGARTR